MAWGVVLCNCLQGRAVFIQPHELRVETLFNAILAVGASVTADGNTAFTWFLYCIEDCMPLFSSVTIVGIADAMANTLGQAMQLARMRLASAASPILRLMIQRDHEVTESELLRRELEILRAGRENMPPQKRPDYRPAQRLAILQIMRLRGWNTVRDSRKYAPRVDQIRRGQRQAEPAGRGHRLESHG